MGSDLTDPVTGLLAGTLPRPPAAIVVADAADPEQLADLTDRLRELFGHLDGALDAIAFAPAVAEDIGGWMDLDGSTTRCCVGHCQLDAAEGRGASGVVLRCWWCPRTEPWVSGDQVVDTFEAEEFAAVVDEADAVLGLVASLAECDGRVGGLASVLVLVADAAGPGEGQGVASAGQGRGEQDRLCGDGAVVPAGAADPDAHRQQDRLDRLAGRVVGEGVGGAVQRVDAGVVCVVALHHDREEFFLLDAQELLSGAARVGRDGRELIGTLTQQGAQLGGRLECGHADGPLSTIVGRALTSAAKPVSSFSHSSTVRITGLTSMPSSRETRWARS